MTLMKRCLILFISLINIAIGIEFEEPTERKPNVIFILADDLGSNDLSFMGSNNIPTPNIDALAFNGVILRNHYSTPMCTPSRSALMTGKYPIHVGMQDFVIPSDCPYGLGLEEKLMPEYFKEAGYITRLVGKWHLGFYRQAYTPNARGFDDFHGYLGPYIDYYDHTLKMDMKNYAAGYDIRRNYTTDYSTVGTYATDMLTDFAIEMIDKHNARDPLFLQINHLAPHTANEYEPMQAKPEKLKKFSYITSENRRIYAGMVSSLDDSVGRIMEALRRNDMLENSIVVFFSDNGAPSDGTHANTGSNAPLRGQKDGPWEGGVRTPAIIWSPLIKKMKRISNELMHITDWLPTLATVVGFSCDRTLDGIDQWDMISDAKQTLRSDVLINLSKMSPYYAYIKNSFKVVNGTTNNGRYDNWLGSISKKEQFPEASSYERFVKSSQAGQILDHYNQINCPEDLLKVSEIVKMRGLAKIQCPKLDIPNSRKCNPLSEPCLFNIQMDPCEKYNIADAYPDILNDLINCVVRDIAPTAQKPRNRPADPRSDPRQFGGIWTWWWDRLGIVDENEDVPQKSSTGTVNNVCLHDVSIATQILCMVVSCLLIS